MRKLLLAIVSGLALAGGLTGCNAATVAGHANGSAHTVRSLDNFGEIL